MIYIPCDYGVITRNTGDNMGNLNISDLIILDANSKFTILENSNLDTFSSTFTIEELQAKLTEVFGDQWRDLALVQWENIYQDPQTRYGVYRAASYWFPSASTYAPNLATYQSASRDICPCMLFNSRKYLYFQYTGAMYQLNSAETEYVRMAMPLVPGLINLMCTVGQGVGFPSLDGSFNTWESLKTATFGYLSGVTNTITSRGFGLVTNHSVCTTFFNWFFTNLLPDDPSVPSISDCVITVQPYNNSYTGESITPEVTVISIDSQSGTYNYLSENSDYTLTFLDNINPGTASVTITGINNWGGLVTKNFEIVTTTKYPISECSVILTPDIFVYDGNPKRPNIKVYRLDTSTTTPRMIELYPNIDYQYIISNNVQVTNRALVNIVGINNYSGDRQEYFRIISSEQAVSSWSIDYDKGPYLYTGNPIEVGYIGVSAPDHRILVKDEDYTIVYYNNTNIGEAYFRISGIGYYAGYQDCPFYIVQSTESPFIDGGTTEPGGGDGDNDYTTTPIPAGTLPTLSPANSGLTRIYVPTLAQLTALGQYLWYTDSIWETVWNHVKEMVGSLSEAIIGLNFLPIPIETGPTEQVRVLLNNTGVSMAPALSQWVTVDCGTCKVTTQAGSFLDYSPYTSVELFLPFIGSVQLDTDEVMGKTLHVEYRFDIVSGACTAVVEVDGTVFYQYSGHAAIACPITSANFSEYISAAIGVVSSAVGAIAGGVGGAIAGGSIASALTRSSVSVQNTTGGSEVTTSSTEMIRSARNPATNRMRQESRTQGFSRTETQFPDQESVRTTRYVPSKAQEASYLGLGPGQISNTVGSVIGSKPHVMHSGSFSGNSGFLGERKCFLTIKRPKQALPEHYAEVCGYPCMMWKDLGSLIGFTKLHEIFLKDIPATQNELDEILSFLKSGVVL